MSRWFEELTLTECQKHANASQASSWTGATVKEGQMAKVTDLRKPVAATPPQEIMCSCVWLGRFLVLPGTTLPVEQPKYLTWARKGGGVLFTALLPPVRPRG
ncbi:unnamed protein product [Pleuronectes platessa]|uniref:Uncharacterized protein n=1 Tax=Pleuronectes platessa TaxID=8262 RepID=A0A9N7U2J0_PLEPL|nr:unnamed protein product [Pleuronectes platessa]